MIQSPCKIEFVPEGGTAIVLADFGAWLVQLPRFAPAQRIFEAEGVDTAASYFKPLGGVTVAITFEDGILIERTVAAMARSFEEGRWVEVG